MTGETAQISGIRPNDQWKSGGVCQICRRRSYCRTKCTAHREFINARAREYIRRMTGIPEIEKAMRNAGGENNGRED